MIQEFMFFSEKFFDVEEPTSLSRVCCLCGGQPTLRFVGEREYCGEHVKEAFDAARAALRAGSLRA